MINFIFQILKFVTLSMQEYTNHFCSVSNIIFVVIHNNKYENKNEMNKCWFLTTIWFFVFNATFSYIMVTSFSGGRSRREPPTMGKQLVNFITCGCESSLITKKEFFRSTVVGSIWCYWSKLQWNLSEANLESCINWALNEVPL
jgi:hypothetical protein